MVVVADRDPRLVLGAEEEARSVHPEGAEHGLGHVPVERRIELVDRDAFSALHAGHVRFFPSHCVCNY